MCGAITAAMAVVGGVLLLGGTIGLGLIRD